MTPEASAEDCRADLRVPGRSTLACEWRRSYEKQQRQLRRWKRKGVSAIGAIARALCDSDHSKESLLELLEGFGLPAVPRLLRVRLPPGRGCRATPAPAIAAILIKAQRGHDEVVGEFDWVLRALRSRDPADVHAALDVLEELSGTRWYQDETLGGGGPDSAAKRALERQPWEDPWQHEARLAKTAAREKLLRAAVGPLTDFVRTTRGSRRVHALQVIGAMPGYYSHLVPDLVALLDYTSAVGPVLATLRHLGPEAAGAVPELRCRLRRTHSEGLVRAYAKTLSYLGPAARQALPELWMRLRQARTLGPRERVGSVGFVGGAIVRIDPRLRASRAYGGARALLGAVEEAVRYEWRQPFVGSRALWKLMQELPRPLADPTLHAIMHDANAPLDARIRAAQALPVDSATQSPRGRRLQKILIERGQPRRPIGPPAPSVLPPYDPEEAARDELSHRLARCRSEGGLTGSAPALAGAGIRGSVMSASADASTAEQNRAASECLKVRLCGPGLARYHHAIQTCCRYAFGRSQPAWCKHAQRK